MNHTRRREHGERSSSSRGWMTRATDSALWFRWRR